jgi:hypothetical protein
LAGNEIIDPPVAVRCDLGDDGIAIKAKERHGSRKDAGAFVLALVQKFAGGRRDDGMGPVAKMLRRHHGAERLFDRPLRIREKISNAGELLVFFGIEHMQDGADQEGVTGLLPMATPLERAFRVDENVGDILNVTHFGVATPDFE